MTGIDAAVLNLVERFCRKLQLITGRTNVWLAFQLTNLSIIMYFVWAIAYFERVTVAGRVVIAALCAVLGYLLSQTVFKESIDTSEQYAYRRVAKDSERRHRLHYLFAYWDPSAPSVLLLQATFA